MRVVVRSEINKKRCDGEMSKREKAEEMRETRDEGRAVAGGGRTGKYKGQREGSKGKGGGEEREGEVGMGGEGEKGSKRQNEPGAEAAAQRQKVDQTHSSRSPYCTPFSLLSRLQAPVRSSPSRR